MSFVSELKRRKVFQVAAVYLVVAWLIMQVVDVVNEPLRLPEWFATVAILIVAIGFPIALILSWAFDLTPEGVVRDEGTTVAVQSGGRRIEYVLIGLLIVSMGWVLYRVEVTPSEPPVETVAGDAQRDVLPNSVAVIPFDNMSADPEDAYFAAGLHDEILNQLAKIDSLNVIARTSVMQYAGAARPITEIARELNVGTIMEGSVSYAAGRVAIRAQLIDAETGVHLWSDSYNRDFTDVFGIQADIARNVANALAAEFSLEEQASIEKIPTDSPVAYALYLRARALAPNIGPRTSQEFHDALNRALELDPEFALAHATLAFSYAFTPGVEDHEALAREHAEQALTFDPNQGLAYGALALINESYSRWSDARENWERALELSPNNFDVLDDAVFHFSVTGRTDQASLLAARAQKMNPANTSTQLWLHIGSRNFEAWAGIYRNRIDSSARGVGDVNTHINLGIGEAILGNNQSALDELVFAEQLDPNLTSGALAQLAYAYGRIGRSDEASRVFDQFQELVTSDGASNEVAPISRVFANLGISDEDEVLDLLTSFADSPGPHNGGRAGIMRLVWNSYADPILDQPEFLEVRSRLGFRE